MSRLGKMLGPDRVAFWGLTRWQLAVIIWVGAYVTVAILLFGVAFRYLCVGAILIGLAASGRANGKRFLLDWFPLLLFWIGYDWMRELADQIVPRVAVTTPYELEMALFGWLAGGQVPALYFLRALADSPWRQLVNGVADLFYWSHFVVIQGYMLYLWWHPPTPLLFKKFVCGLTLLHILTLATYFLYPAAPPWYVFYFGFEPPSLELLTNPFVFRTPMVFQDLWVANPNRFAAIPSLHGAYPVLFFLLVPRGGGRRWAVVVYGFGVWLATVVRGHHYIIDLFLGAFYAWPCAWIANHYVNEAPARVREPSETPIEERALP